MIVLMLSLVAVTLVFVLIVLGANRELRERQEWLTEALGEAHRELAEAQQQARFRTHDELTVERYLETL